MINKDALALLKRGKLRIKVKRSGMHQFQIFTARKVPFGSSYTVELFLDKVLDVSEAKRVSNELMIPVHTKNAYAFPEGKGAKDFLIG